MKYGLTTINGVYFTNAFEEKANSQNMIALICYVTPVVPVGSGNENFQGPK